MSAATGSTVHELVEAQVRRTPAAVAVVAEGAAVSYADLNAAANRLARHLRSRGIGAGAVVGVRMRRGVDLVVALLGVMKAGAAYLPLDPDLPEERLAFMLADSGASLVLASAGTDAVTQLSHPGESGQDLGLPGSPDAPAYVMYTSGSTGRPKGVVVAHRGVVNRLRFGLAEYPLTATDRVLQKTPYSFDVSVPEIFCPLAAGATLVMAKPGGHRDPAYLVDLIRSAGITSVHFVPSMLRAFLAEPFDALPSVRLVFCSGEALTADLVRAVHERLSCALHNLYGPTEASIEVTAVECRPGEPVTIGRPLPGVETRIVDADLREVAEGELLLGGVQVAHGYLNRPALTAERFVPNPFGGGDRLYRTGDRARREADGTITYLGRLDNQVKVRGNRVELGEIEAALAAHPALAAAVVTLSGGDLVAYLVPAGPRPAVVELREFLARTLPDYMVPSRWLALPELPVTSSGKADRGALPADAPPWEEVAHEPPASPVEEAIAEVLAEVLGVDRFGRHDDFFERGGHSLLVTRVVALLGERFPVEVPVAAVFESPTVAGLAETVHAAVAAHVTALSESDVDTMLAEVRD
ncbi:amino acid adenylation domain-containing protein [Actinophytocola sp.]|uniref:amino acid adenylation domain-containing protein n=1 Tax=Actinophytocola sp. TaxID=1872138 RepID=UPI00389AE55A